MTYFLVNKKFAGFLDVHFYLNYMNVRHLSPRLASSPEKNFDINLKINF